MADKAAEIVRKMLTGEGRELSMEELEGVTGGTMTADELKLLDWGLGFAKKSGLTLKEVLSYIPQYYSLYHSSHPNVTIEEVEAYITANY